VVARDKAVADDIVTWITEFYDEHPDLEPVSGFWKDLWRGIKDWCEDHILDEILLTIATIVGVVFGAIIVASGWGGIVTVLVAILGISEGVAIVIATILAVIAVGSSVASAILDINDLWYKIDDEEFNKWQSGLALTAFVTNLIFSLPDIFKLFRLGATKLSAIFAKDVAKTAGDDIAKAVTNNLDEVGKLTDDVVEGGLDAVENITDAARMTQKSIIESVENSAEGSKGLTNLQKGNYGEMKMDDLFESQGYERISTDRVTDLNQATHQGIDGVYYNPDGHPPYIIEEAKYGSSKLGSTLDGKQMSDNWIDKRLVDAVGEEMADDIILEMMLNPDNVQKQLVNISTDGNVTTKILDEYANVVK